ncbi:MAG TPA: hypothetical protein VFU41_00750 [Gemmatimonadales bacterium]|nr:hypothetical protein [Gemmatimonadales bacterium]
MNRPRAVLLALGAAVACAEWAGPALGRPGLAIVPVFATAQPQVPGAGVLVSDLDRLRVIVRKLPAASVVADTAVAVDADGNAVLTVPVLVLGGTPTSFEVALEGIRTSDGAVLYTGIDTVVVIGGTPTPPESIPVTYVGPCAAGAGCSVTVGPPGIVLKQAESVPLTVTVLDAVGSPVPNVPVRLTNITPGLVALTSGLAVTALSGTSCGPARIAASIPGSADTLRVTVNMPVTQAAVLFAGDSGGGLSSGVFCSNSDGSGRFNISRNGAFGDVNPRWSPDRQRVAYTFQPAGPFPPPQELWVSRWAGDTQAFVTGDTASGAYRPRWSPNGLHLAYECRSGSSNNVCVILDATGPIVGLSQQPRTVLSNRLPGRTTGTGSFAWDPLQPDRLAFVRDSLTIDQKTTSAIYLASFDGTQVQPLTPTPLALGRGVLQIDEIDWSPRGDVIVFSAIDTQFIRKLYAINRDGGGFREVTKGPDYDSRPVVSPDGSQILFLRDRACSFDYWRIRIDGTGEQQVSSEGLCDTSTGRLGHDWSPDGTAIVLVGAGPLGGYAVYRLPAGATASTYLKDRVLASRGADAGGFVNDIQPSWRP